MGWGSVSCFVRPGPTRPLSPVSAGPGNASNVGPGTGWGLSEGCVLLKRDLRRYKHFTTIVTCGPLAVPCITLSRQIATPGTLLSIKKSLFSCILQLFPTWAWPWCRVESGGAGSRSSEAVLPGSAQQTSLSCTQQSATLQSPDMGNVSSCQCCQGESGARSWPGVGQEWARRPLWPRWCACSGGGGHMSPGAPLPLSPVRGCGQKPCQQSMSDWTTKYSPPGLVSTQAIHFIFLL